MEENKEVMEENKKTVNKKAILDWIVCAIAVIALVVCYFFWGCRMDLFATVLAAVVVITGTFLLQKQNKKIKELNEAQASE